MDQAATHLVEGWFSNGSGWELRRRDPDFAIDYELERILCGEPAGQYVFVQQKAADKLKFKDQGAVHVLKTKHLLYYWEMADRPVFLFLIDVTNRFGYFLFLQQWIQENSSMEALREQGTVTVYVPSGNMLHEGPCFLAAHQQSLQWMRRHKHVSIEEAMHYETSALSALDPRFRVSLDIVNQQKRFTLRPIEPVNFTLNVKTRNIAPLKAFIDYGKPIELNTHEWDVDGMPLLEYLGKGAGAHKLAITPTPITLVAHLSVLGASVPPLVMTAKVTSGQKGCVVEGRLEHGPLAFSLVVELDGSLASPIGKASFFVPTDDSWRGKPYRSLPTFEWLSAFFGAIDQGSSLRLEFYRDGVLGPCGIFRNVLDVEWIRSLRAVLNLIFQIREIASHYGCNPLFSSFEELQALDREDLLELSLAYRLIAQPQVTIQNIGFSCTVCMPEKATPRACLENLKQSISLNLVKTCIPYSPPLLGRHIMDLEYEITKAAFTVPPETEAVYDVPTSEPFIIDLGTTAESQVTVRRLDPPTPVP